ncbi:MAG: hypothetical protein ABR981_01070 [Candidatus Micrarchaeaceae archaeon]|jgi:hypothetical protein
MKSLPAILVLLFAFAIALGVAHASASVQCNNVLQQCVGPTVPILPTTVNISTAGNQGCGGLATCLPCIGCSVSATVNTTLQQGCGGLATCVPCIGCTGTVGPTAVGPNICTGNPSLSLNPNPTGPNSTVDAIVSGLENCNGYIVTIKDYQGCSGTTIGWFVSGPNGGNVYFQSPGSQDSPYGYYACIDGMNSSKAILIVLPLSNTNSTVGPCVACNNTSNSTTIPPCTLCNNTSNSTSNSTVNTTITTLDNTTGGYGGSGNSGGVPVSGSGGGVPCYQCEMVYNQQFGNIGTPVTSFAPFGQQGSATVVTSPTPQVNTTEMMWYVPNDGIYIMYTNGKVVDTHSSDFAKYG